MFYSEMSPSCANFAVRIWDSTAGHICDLPDLCSCPRLPNRVLLIIHYGFKEKIPPNTTSASNRFINSLKISETINEAFSPLKETFFSPRLRVAICVQCSGLGLWFCNSELNEWSPSSCAPPPLPSSQGLRRSTHVFSAV